MASPNEKKLLNQQSSNSDPPTPTIPAAAELPFAEIAGNHAQAPEEDEVAVLTTTATLASGAEDHHSEQAQGESNEMAPDTAVADIRAGAAEPQQRDRTEGVTMAPATTTTPNQGEEDSDNELQEFSDGEVGEGELDTELQRLLDSNVSENYLDDKIFVDPEPEPPIDEHPDIHRLSPFNAGNGQEANIADDLRNYGDVQGIFDGEDGWGYEESHIAEAIRNSLAYQATPDQAISAAPAESAHGDGGDSGSVTGTAAGSDGGETATSAALGSDLGHGDNNGSTAPASNSFDYGDVGRGGPAIPASNFSQNSEEDNDLIRPNSTGSGHEDGENGSSVAATPAGSDHGNEAKVGSVIATSAEPDNGSRERSSDLMTHAPASYNNDGADNSGLETGNTAGFDAADEGNSDSVSSDLASGEGISAPSQEDKDTQREAREEEEVPGDSDAPTEATSSGTTDESEVQDPTATPAPDGEGTPSQADAETDHGQDVIDLLPPEIPDSPIQPPTPFGGNILDIDIDDGEPTPNPVDRVFALTGYQRPEVGALTTDGKKGMHIAESLGFHVDNSEGVGEPADTITGAKTAAGDLGEGDAILIDRASSPSNPNQTAVEAGNKDSDTIHLRIQYLVEGSKKSKATICIAVPTAITYPALKRSILNALHHHEGFINPRPIEAGAEISRLVVVLAQKESGGAADLCTDGELTDGELTDVDLQGKLRLMNKRSIYDYVKVLFVPGTNGKMRPRKATGRIYGKSRKVGGL